MILTPILGEMAFAEKNRGERVHGIASAHGAGADPVADHAKSGFALRERKASDGEWRRGKPKFAPCVARRSALRVDRRLLTPSRSHAYGYVGRALGAHAGDFPRPSLWLGRAPKTHSLGTLRFGLAGLGGQRRMPPRLRRASVAGGRVLGTVSTFHRVDSTECWNVSG